LNVACGAVIRSLGRDVVLYGADASVGHQLHNVAHGLAHIALDHWRERDEGVLVDPDTIRQLAPDRPGAELVNRLLVTDERPRPGRSSRTTTRKQRVRSAGGRTLGRFRRLREGLTQLVKS
jgi:hypothetical protein